jgi:hypothetical protein
MIMKNFRLPSLHGTYNTASYWSPHSVLQALEVPSVSRLRSTVNLDIRTPLGQAFWCPYKRGSL